MKKKLILSLLTTAITSLVHAGDEYVITIEPESNLADYSDQNSLISDFLEAKEFLLSTENMIAQPEKTKHFLRVLDDLSDQNFFPATEFLGLTLFQMILSDSFSMPSPFMDQKSLIEKAKQIYDVLLKENKRFNILASVLYLNAGEKNNIQNEKKAISLLEESLKAGNGEAGMILYKKFGRKKGFETTKRWLESAITVDENFKYYLASHIVLEYHQKKRTYDNQYNQAFSLLKQGVREFNSTVIPQFWSCYPHLHERDRLEKIIEILLESPSLSKKIPLTLETMGDQYNDAQNSERALFYYKLAYEAGADPAGSSLLEHYQTSITDKKNELNKKLSKKKREYIKKQIEELEKKKQEIYNQGIERNSACIINAYAEEILDNVQNGLLPYSPDELNKLINLMITGANKSLETSGFLDNRAYWHLVNLYAYASGELRQDFLEKTGLSPKRKTNAFWSQIKDFFHNTQSNDSSCIPEFFISIIKNTDTMISYYKEYLIFLEEAKSKDQKYVLEEIPTIKCTMFKNIDFDIKEAERSISLKVLDILSNHDIIFLFQTRNTQDNIQEPLDPYINFLSSNIVDITERLLYNILPTRYTQPDMNRENWLKISDALQAFIPIFEHKITANSKDKFYNHLSKHINLYEKIIDKSPIVALLMLQQDPEFLSPFFANLKMSNEKTLNENEIEKTKKRRTTITLLLQNEKIKSILSNKDNILKSFEEQINFIQPFSDKADRTLPKKQQHKKQSDDNTLSKNVKQESDHWEDQSNLMRYVTPTSYSFDELSEHVSRSSLTKEMKDQANLVLDREKRKEEAKKNKTKGNFLINQREKEPVNHNVVEEEHVDQTIILLGAKKYNLFKSIIEGNYTGTIDAIKNLVQNTLQGSWQEGEGSRINFSIPILNREEYVDYSIHTPHKNQDKNLKPEHIKDLKKNLLEKAGYNLETVKYRGNLNIVTK